MRKLWLLVCLASCDPVEAVPGLDGAPDGRRCDPGKDFGEPVRIEGLNSLETSDQDVRLTADELTLVYARGVPGSEDSKLNLYLATRPSRDAAWSTPSMAPFARINDLSEQRAPSLSDDGLTLYFANYVVGEKYEIAVATRATTLGEFGPGEAIAGLNVVGVNERDPWFLPGGDVVYFVSQRDDAVSYHVYRAERDGSVFAPAERILELEGPDGMEVTPVVSPDELTIYWSSERSDLGGKGSVDIYRAHRERADLPFGSIENVASVNSASTDVATWVSADDCVMYLRSERPSNDEFYSDVFVARRPL
jgi:hypothetical protein